MDQRRQRRSDSPRRQQIEYGSDETGSNGVNWRECYFDRRPTDWRIKQSAGFETIGRTIIQSTNTTFRYWYLFDDSFPIVEHPHSVVSVILSDDGIVSFAYDTGFCSRNNWL
jgi:hypothetical protein